MTYNMIEIEYRQRPAFYILYLQLNPSNDHSFYVSFFKKIMVTVYRGKIAIQFSFGEWKSGRLMEVAVLSGGRLERFHCMIHSQLRHYFHGQNLKKKSKLCKGLHIYVFLQEIQWGTQIWPRKFTRIDIYGHFENFHI